MTRLGIRGVSLVGVLSLVTAVAASGCATRTNTTDGAADGARPDTAGPEDGGPAPLDGFVVLPDGAVVPADGDPPPPDGSVVVPDGSVVAPDGAPPPRGGGPTPRDGGPGPDGSTSIVRIGTRCMTDADCPGRFCSPSGSGFGYCSWLCNDANPCPDMAVCAVFGSGSTGYCMPGCDETDPMACGPGYICQGGIADEPVCYPGCTSDSDCRMGQRCGMGVSGVPDCYTPTASVGDPCTRTAECPDSGYCLSENDWGAPHGTCVTFCNLATGFGCGSGTTCVAWGTRGAGSCVPTCDAMTACRAGYSCVPTRAGGPSACVPRCTMDSDCTGRNTCSFVTGRCTRER